MGPDAKRDLRTMYPFRMQVHEQGFGAHEVVGPGSAFYDILLGWRDDRDNSIIFNDIGGQSKAGWNPEEGHGSVWRLTTRNELRPIVPPGAAGRWAYIHILQGAAHFAASERDIFIVAQTGPGRPYASRAHCVLRVRDGARRPELFASVPDVGDLNGGHAGAMMPDVLGAQGSRFEGWMFIHSMMNCTIYRVPQSDGQAEPFVRLGDPDHTIMPRQVRIAPPWWGDLAGDLVFSGVRGASFHSKGEGKPKIEHWRVLEDGGFEEIRPDPSWAPLNARQAPAEFGPFGGHVFWTDEGPVNLAQVAGCDEYADGLPYSGRVLRQSPQGEISVFADDFYGSSTSIVFDRSRLIMGLSGRSYSTGEFHEPDASLYEVRYEGGHNG